MVHIGLQLVHHDVDGHRLLVEQLPVVHNIEVAEIQEHRQLEGSHHHGRLALRHWDAPRRDGAVIEGEVLDGRLIDLNSFIHALIIHSFILIFHIVIH